MVIMKKVLIIHTNYQNIGGEDIAVKSEIEFLSKHFDVQTLYFSNKIENLFSTFNSFLTNRNFKSDNLILEKINSFKPDVVYFHNTWYKIQLGIFEVLKKNNIKTIIKLHNFRYYCTKSIFHRSHLNGKQYCEACGQDFNRFKIFNKYFKESYLKSFFVYLYGRKYIKILKDPYYVKFVLTKHHKKFFKQEFGNNENFYIFPNKLKKDLFNDLGKENFIVYAGRLSNEKGITELIEAFLSLNLNEIKLKIIGGGPLENILKNKYKHFENITFLGELKNKETIKFIAKSKAVVTATKLFEGQPTLLCEASIYGIPSIFPKTGGIQEFFPNDYSLSFEQYDYSDLASKLTEFFYREDIEKIGFENQKYILKYLDENKLINMFNKII